ncbi:hypothetical protein, partial [Gilliamella apicola]|uniref:hypothetical protein n=1 Tax=Gilliamella apicola TaxID=1196095 RepID=UPI002FEE2C70
ILNPLCLPISPPGLKTNYKKVIRFECCAFYSSEKYRQLKIKKNCSIAQCLSYFSKLLGFSGFNDVFITKVKSKLNGYLFSKTKL